MLDLAIYAYLGYLIYRLVNLIRADSLVALSFNRDSLSWVFGLVLLVVLDLFIDITNENDYKKADKLKHDFIRLGCMLLAGLCFIGAYSYVHKSNDPYTTAKSESQVDRVILRNYTPISENAALLEEEIYNTYGIRVYTGLNPSDYLSLSGYICTPSTDVQKSERYLTDIYNALSVYSENALSVMPRRIFIVESVQEDRVAGINFNRTDPKYNFIVFCDKYDSHELIIHHELFHTLNVYTDENILNDFNENSESCAITSDYACTSSVEFAADSWAYAVTYHKYTEHSEILEGAYSSFLKGFSNDLENSESDYAELINNSDKDIFYVENFDEEFFKQISNMYNCDDPYSFLGSSIDYISNGEEALIYKKQNLVDKQKYDSFCESIQSITDQYSNYTGIMKILKVYEHLKGIETLDDFEIDSAKYFYNLINSSYSTVHYSNEYYNLTQFKNYCMSIALKQLGYDIQLLRYTEDDHNLFFIKQDINQYSYIYDFLLEKREMYNIVPGFMAAPDDYRIIHDDIAVLDNYSYENDRSYGDYNRILLLDEFDKKKVDDYVISMFRKYGLKATVVIISSNEETIDDTVNYLYNERTDDLSNLQILYNRYINRYYYPGYSSYVFDSIYYVYNFH